MLTFRIWELEWKRSKTNWTLQFPELTRIPHTFRLYKSSWIDDLENRSRRDNFRIRGLPDPIIDIPVVVQELVKTLIPSIPPHKLESDRAHRSLGLLRKYGSQRDMVIKPHFYGVKEEIMKTS